MSEETTSTAPKWPRVAGRFGRPSRWLAGLFLATLTAEASAQNTALSFNGSSQYVTFGVASGLGTPVFTLEVWFNWSGGGATASTGSGGITDLIPLLTKGRNESDASNVDANYVLGIRLSTGSLAADFEDNATGANHPIVGSTPVTPNVWHHAAATYDGTTWRLYLDGNLDGSLAVGATPRADSIQHAGLATAMNSSGSRAGFFAGVLDEARVWNVARSQALIQSTMNQEVVSAPGLLGRWGMNEGSGTVVTDSSGSGINGGARPTSAPPAWVSGAPFRANVPPDAPVLNGPLDGATNVTLPPSLDVRVSDPDGDNLTVTYYGRPVAAAPPPDFTLIVLPDTQFYTSSLNGGSPAIFNAQTQWIVDNLAARNIAYVAHVGDCTQNGDNNGDPVEWEAVDAAMSKLEDPAATQLPEGLPYGIAVGNHDQSPEGNADGTTAFFNEYFGQSRYAGRTYYGGHYGSSNDNFYEFFSSGGLDFIVVYLEYDTSPDAAVFTWADGLLKTYSNRRAIVVSHYVVNSGFDAGFSAQGQAIYDTLKDNPNLFLMVSGHLAEGQRTDTFGGRTVWSLMSDYQGRTAGGDGWLRIMEFSPANDVIHVKTYSPWLNQFETDADSQFDIPYDMNSQPFAVIATNSGVPSGSNSTTSWSGLAPSTGYEWFVTIGDGATSVTGPVWRFTTAGTPVVNQPPSVYAGADQSIALPSSASLAGSVSDDGLPNPPAAVATTWSTVSGPGTVTFGDASAIDTTAGFSAAGTYVLRLTASDGQLDASDDVTVTVNGGGQLSVVRRGTIHSSANAISYSFAPVTASNNRLYVVFLGTSVGSGTAPLATSVSGAGLNFTEIGTTGGLLYSGTPGVRRIQAWRALVGSGATTGPIVINLAAASTGMDAVLLEFDGVDTSGTNGSGAVVQSASRKASKVTSLTVTLASFQNASNRPVAFFSHRAAEATTEEPGYAELDDGTHGSPPAGAECEWSASAAETTPSASWLTAANAGAFAMEVRSAGVP